MRNFFIALWKVYRLAVGTIAVVLLLLHFVLFAPSRQGPPPATMSSAQGTGEVNPVRPAHEGHRGQSSDSKER